MGLMNSGGFQYYGGPNAAAAGVSSFADNFMKTYLALKQSGREDEALTLQKQFRDMQMSEMARKQQQDTDKQQAESSLRSDVMNLRGNVNMPGLMQSGIVDPVTQSSDPVALKQMAMGQTPQGMTPDMVKQPAAQDYFNIAAPYMSANKLGEEAMKMAAQKETVNPIITTMIKAAQDGTLDERGVKLLESLGYGGMFKEKPSDKTPNTTALTIGKLRKDLGREPTEAEVLKETEGRELRIAGAKTTVTEKAKQEVQKGLIADDTIKQWAEYVITKGEFPVEFGRLFRTPIAQIEAQNKVTKYLQEHGVDGADRAVQSAAYSANKKSLDFQEKQFGAAQSFVLNIKGQIGRVNEIMKDTIKRVGVRAADIPIRELKTRFAGSGHERVLESYLMEISREIGKLSTGSQASIQELSVEAQKKWDKIHDPNLSLNELNKILDATNEQATIRIKSMSDVIEDTKKRFGFESKIAPFDIKLPPGASPEGVAGAIVKNGKVPPQGAIDELKKNPKLSIFFDQKYGKGSSKQYLR